MATIIGQYELKDVLGGGAMATVYVGEHVAGIGMQAAVKKLHPHLALDDRIRTRLRIEAKALARLEHPNIVRLLDFVDLEDTCALVTELVGGRTLRQVMASYAPEPMPLDIALKLMRQMLAGVAHAHEHSCLHRDLKPGNIMVTDRWVVKVLDFGIASLLDREGITATGVSIGTPVYMPPEQYNGMETLDRRADIFALGVTFWEMLAGPGKRPAGVMGWKIGPQELLVLLEQGYRQSLVDVVEAMVQPDRENRLQSCEDVLNALAWAMDDSTADETIDRSTARLAAIAQLRELAAAPLDGSDAGIAAAAAGGVGAPTTLGRDLDSARLGHRATAAGRPTAPQPSTGGGGLAGGPIEERAARPYKRRAPDAEPTGRRHHSQHDTRSDEPTEPIAGALARSPETLHEDGRPARRKKGPRKGRVDPSAPETPTRIRKQRRRSRVGYAAAAIVAVGAVAAVAVVVAFDGPSLSDVRGGPELVAALSVDEFVVFDRSAFFYGDEDRKVVLSAFALGRTEVTLGQWHDCVAAGVCEDIDSRYSQAGGIAAASPAEPVQFVRWQEAGQWCAWAVPAAGLPAGYASRLPSDAEWERAARGASRPGRRFPLGDTLDPKIATLSGFRLPPAGSTEADATPEGVRDLTGSVEEWTWDAGEAGLTQDEMDHSYPNEQAVDPVNPPGRSARGLRGVRGGNIEYGGVDERWYRSTGRRWVDARRAASGRGFRCAIGPVAVVDES